MRLISTFVLSVMISTCVLADPIDLRKSARLALPYMTNQLEEPTLVRKAIRKSTKKMAVLNQEVAPYYIYSRGEGRGFVIISGDDALPEVLGYTESGDFDENNITPFLSWYLDYYGKIIEDAQDEGAGRMETKKYAAAARTDVKPLIETHWSQGGPYSDQCPLLKNSTTQHCVTGCVATAAAQILYYWRRDLPDYTQATVTSYTKGDNGVATKAYPKGTALKWDLMRTSYSGGETAEYKEAVATLMGVVGGAAKLTYGSSTSGYTEDIVGVNSTYFNMNGGKGYVKDWGGAENNYSDDAWATMLYNELKQMHPIMYSGVKDGEGGGGHAVVVDGYQASTKLFHFNIGWGGSNDGYYTVARGKNPSWGFNDSWQQCIIGACPKVQNLKASVIVPPVMYKNRTGMVKVKVKNFGTLPYSGIYLHGNTTGKKPTSLGSAKSAEKETEMANDGTEYLFQMEIKPTADTYYIFVTDNKLNVLASAKVETEEPESDLWFNGIDIAGSTDCQDGFRIVYHEKTCAEATLVNKSDVAYEGSVKISLYCSSDGGENFNFLSDKSTKVEIPANGEATASFSLVSSSGCPIRVDSLYKVVMKLETADGIAIHKQEGTVTETGFILKGSDMAVQGFENGCVKLTGHWDPLFFSTTIKKTAYKTATAYDLTEVTSIDKISDSPVNPNALFYVIDADVAGTNVVCQNSCKELLLTPGFNFAPMAEFTASHAIVDLAQEPNKWYLLTAPCDLDVPDGILARRIESHLSSGISNKATNVRQLQAGQTYMVLTTSTIKQLLPGNDTQIVTAPVTNTDTAMIGVFVNAETPEGAFMLDFESTQYFQPVGKGAAVEALRGYFLPSNVTKAFKASSNIAQDPTYQSLGEAISNAYRTRDIYRDIVYESAYSALTDSIAKAETIYSGRVAANSVAKATTNRLIEQTNWYMKQITDPGIAPIDYTDRIQNPSFEANNTRGWTIEATNYASVRSASNVSYKGVGADGTYLLYNNKSSNLTGCGISQTIEGLPAGYYKLSAMLGSAKGNTITLFANDSTKTVESHPFGQYYLTEAVIEDIRIKAGESLTIGVKAGNWYKADDFRLYYTANDPTSIEEIMAEEGAIGQKGTYDLSGMAVGEEHLSRGIYIRNGKKILVR